MKKFLALLFVSAFVVGSAFAASSTDLSLTGTIAQRLEASVTTGAVALTLDYTGAGNTSSGAVTLISNRKAWHVTLTSLNTWKLVDTDGLEIPYKVQVVAGTIVFGAGTVVNNLDTLATPSDQVATAITAANYRTPAAGKTFTLAIATNPDLGVFYNFDKTYTDTITVTIIAG